MGHHPDPLEALTEALGGRRPPQGLAVLPAETLDALADAVYDACDRQAEELGRSLDRALKVAPFPVRGLLKKMLGR